MHLLSRSVLSSFALLALAAGCSGPKSDTTKQEDKKKSSVTGEKVTETPLAAPVKVATLPKDTAEAKHEGALGYAIRHGSPQSDSAEALAIDANGDYLVAGYFRAPGLFDQPFAMADGLPDAFLAKLSHKDGSAIWSVALGGKNSDVADAVAVGKDGSSVVVGTLSEEFHIDDAMMTSEGADDIFIAKFAADGHRLWALQIGGHDIDAAHAVVIDDAGNAYVTGVFRHKVVFGQEQEVLSKGNADIFLSKISPSGDFIWTKTFGALDDDFGRSLALDSHGNLLLLAEISNQVDLGGGMLTTNGNRDIVIAKFDSDGEHIWSKSMGNNFDDIGTSLTIDPADNILITGSFEGSLNLGGTELVSAGKADLFAAKFNANGKPIWSRRFGGTDKDWGNRIASDAFGNTYLTGWFWNDVDFDEFKLTSKGQRDAFLAKLDPKGHVLWAKGFGNKGWDMGKSLAVNAEGGVVAVGAFHEAIDFGAGEIKSESKDGSADMYLATFGK